MACLDLGILDAHNKHYTQAERQLVEVIRLDPTQVGGHFRLAEVYRAEGKIRVARAQFKVMSELHQKTAEKLYKQISGAPLLG